MQPHIGHGLQPMPDGGIPCTEVGEVETGEEILFDIAHSVFHPALFIALAHIARHDAKAVVRGKVSVPRIEHRRFARGALQHSRFEVVHHDFLGNGAKVFEGVLMASQEVFHGLRDGEFHIEHAAVAQHHDKETQAAARLPDLHRVEGPQSTWAHSPGAKASLRKAGCRWGLTVRT